MWYRGRVLLSWIFLLFVSKAYALPQTWGEGNEPLAAELLELRQQASHIWFLESGSVMAQTKGVEQLSNREKEERKQYIRGRLNELEDIVEGQDHPRLRALHRDIAWQLNKALPFEAVQLVHKEALALLFNARCHPLDPVLGQMCGPNIQDPEELRRIAVEELGYTGHPESVLFLYEIVIHRKIFWADGSVFRSYSPLHLRLKAIEALGNLGWLVADILKPEELRTLLEKIRWHQKDHTSLYFGTQWFESEQSVHRMLRRTEERIINREHAAVYTFERWQDQKDAWYPKRLVNLVPDIAYSLMSCFGWDENSETSQAKCDNNIKSLGTAPIYRFVRDTASFVGSAVWDFRRCKTLSVKLDEARVI